MTKRLLPASLCSFLVLTALPVASGNAAEDIPGVQAGYQDGFYVKTSDDRFGFKVGTRLDFGYTYGFVSPQPNFSSFDLVHAKFYAGGNAYGNAVQFFFQAAAASDSRRDRIDWNGESTGGGLTLEDYYARLNWNENNFKLGQFKIPFGRQAMIYSGNLQFVDRSIVTKAFTLGRDRGIALTGERPTFGYTLGIFNGGGTPSGAGGLSPFHTNGQNVSNDIAGGGSDHLYVIRLVAIPMGSAGYSEGNVEKSEGNRFDWGIGAVFDQGRDVDINGDAVLDDDNASVLNLGTDITFKTEGKALQAEFFYRKLFGTSIADFDAMGFYVQPGYFIIPSKFEIALRFGWLDPDRSVSSDLSLEGAAAANYYWFGDHRYKTQLQYSWRGQENALGGRNDDSYIDLLFQLTL